MRRAPRRALAIAGALAALAALVGGLGALAGLGAAALAQAPAPASPGSGPLPGMLAGVVASVVAAQGGPTWQPLPEVAARARAAVAGLTEDPLEAVAHGDPGMGCFVLVLRLGSGGEALHRALHDALAQQAPPWTIDNLTLAGDRTGVRSGFAFAGEALQGEVRVMSRGHQQQRTRPAPGAPTGDSMLAACFHDDAREPARSARLCQRMLPALEDALHTIPETFP